MNKLLQWELDWIDANLDRYSSLAHAQSVKHRIEYRYWAGVQAPAFRAQVREVFPEIHERKVVDLANVMIGDVYHEVNTGIVLVDVYASTTLWLKDEDKNAQLKKAVKNYVAENREYMERLFKEDYHV